MQVADMPKGKSLLSTIESFLTGKPSIEIDDRPPIDTELRRTTYEPQETIDTQQDVSKLYGDRQFTPETIGEDPQQQYYGPEGFQNIIESAKGTVAQEAKKIIDKGDDYDAEKVDKESAERMKKAIGILKSPAQAIREFLGAKPADAQEMTDSTAKQIAAYNQAENTILKEEVSMTDSRGNSLGNTTDEILGNIEKSSNINYNESTKLFEPYQVRRADGTLEPFWTIGVGQKLTENLPVDANGVITSAPPAGQTKEQVINNFKGNVRTAFDGAKKVMEEDYGAVWGNLPAGGMSVTTQVAFQNGIKYKDPTTGKFKGLFEFKKANEALAKGDIATAQKEYLDSKWGKADSPRRAKLVVGDLAPNSTVNTIWKRTTAVTKPAEVAPLPDALLQQETGFDPTVSQPLQQTFIPPSVPTRDDILRAGGIDAYVESLPQDVDQKATGLQDLPVGVSIEADGRFTGTGGLGDQTQTAFGLSPGALGGRIVETPQVSQRRRRDTPTSTGLLEFGGTGGGAKTRLDSRARLKEQASLRRLQDSIAQTGAVQPPSMDDQMAAITDVTPAAPERLVLRQQPPISPGGMGGVLPQVGETAPQPITPFTPLSKPSDIAKLMPSTADIEAQKAAEARKAREEQEKKIYEETQARIAKQMADAAKEEQQKKARLEAEATEKARLEALKKDREERDRIKKTNQMNQARNEVIMAGGDPFEADKAAHAVFLDQSDAIRRNEELNRGKTLTQVIQEENRREEDSGGGSGGGGGFGGGSSGGDDKIVCTEMYRQTQLVDWQKAMKIWDVYQRRYLTPEHQIGYHWLFKPYVKGMQRNRLLTKLGAILAKRRTQHLKHILTKGKAKDDLVGKLWCSIIHPIVHKAGKIKNFLDSKTKAT
jgi:hypothetical protein